METSTLILGAIFLCGALVATLSPIFQQNRQRTTQHTRDLQNEVHDLRTRLGRMLDSIHDLDFDYDTGKINTDVYAQQRKLLIGRGVSLLIQLDKVEGDLYHVDNEIESAIASRRSKKSTVNTPAKKQSDNVDSAIEAAVSARREVSS